MSQYSLMEVEVARDILRRKYDGSHAMLQVRDNSRNILTRVAKDFMALAADNTTDAALYLRQLALEFQNLVSNTLRNDRPEEAAKAIWHHQQPHDTWTAEMSTLQANGLYAHDVNEGAYVLTPYGRLYFNKCETDRDLEGEIRMWTFSDPSGTKFIVFND